MRIPLRAAALALAAVLSASGAALAAPFNFVIDPGQSSLTIAVGIEGEDDEGNLVFATLTAPQTAGSDTTAVSGSINANYDGAFLELLATGDLQFANQADPQFPGPVVAAYGLLVDSALAGAPGLVSGFAAASSLVGDASSGPIALAGVNFDASAVTLGLLTATLDYDLLALGNPQVGSSVVSNQFAVNSSTGGTLLDLGGTLELTIPVSVIVPVDVGGFILSAVLTGQIVATAVVPEPGTVALLAIGAVGLVPFVARRARRR